MAGKHDKLTSNHILGGYYNLSLSHDCYSDSHAHVNAAAALTRSLLLNLDNLIKGVNNQAVLHISATCFACWLMSDPGARAGTEFYVFLVQPQLRCRGQLTGVCHAIMSGPVFLLLCCMGLYSLPGARRDLPECNWLSFAIPVS